MADLEAENARLQARLDNQEPWLVALGRMLVQHRIVRFPDDVLAWRDERNRYKALAERRGEALEGLMLFFQSGNEVPVTRAVINANSEWVAKARAAIAAELTTG